ncbi:MAG: hypothetical protein R3E86_17785 [Pseudomonadales bacterium]
MRYFLRFMLVATGFALTTAGLMAWHARGFSFSGVWFENGALALHPLHLLIVGLAMIPPALWEIFVLEHAAANDR